LEKTSVEVDRALLDLNVVGPISLTKSVLPHMIERHEGQIVVVSSLVGKFGKYHLLNCLNLMNFMINELWVLNYF